MHHQTARPGRPLRAGGMLGQRRHFGPMLAAIVADEERAGIDAGVQAIGFARVGLDDPESLDRVAAAFGEPDAGGGLAPGVAEIARPLHGRTEPTTLPRDHDRAARRQISKVIDLTALQEWS